MLRPKALHHVALSVADMDKTLHFYQALGLALLRTSDPGADGVRSAVLRIGSQELNVFHTPGLVAGDDEHRTGMHHYCLDMDAKSMDELIAELGEAGLRVVRGPVQRRDGTSVFVHDPDGVRVELRIGQS
jgi:catechol 2,3-dioxygenase-like lactoylglutathione lyase family enzyme